MFFRDELCAELPTCHQMNCNEWYELLSLCRLLFKLLLLSSCSPVVMCISRMSRFGVVHSSFIIGSTMTNSKVNMISSSSIVKFANNMDDTTNVYNNCPTIHTLLQRARKVRQRIDDTTCIHVLLNWVIHPPHTTWKLLWKVVIRRQYNVDFATG